MQIIDAEWDILWMRCPQAIMEQLECIGRISYKSENKIQEGSAGKFIQARINQGHESILEHESITVKFICDRKTSHQLVRHRLASYTQESTRFCNYKNEITFIRPPYWRVGSMAYEIWTHSMMRAEIGYMELVAYGCPPEEAALILPNSTKTEIVVTANLREWRHIFRLRCDSHADLGIRLLMTSLRDYLRGQLPVIFGDV